MTPELYRHVNELFHAALALRPDERAAFLDDACNGDETLRARVEALIAAHEQSGDFLDSPVYDLETQAFSAEVSTNLLIGKSVGRYEVLSLLGVGGMGAVYLARDTRLGRKVALKVLFQSSTNDTRRVGRFRREARAASALNHPNIVTIYEIEEADGMHFIAAEYVEGVTLRERLKDGPLKLHAVLDVALQVASALAQAHQHGIIHRDIKPENIMLDADGNIKLLDFGLAKPTPLTIQSEEDSTTQTAYTSAGVILGTIAYMSPEQARGLPVDARTDIWSLGVVVYEMLAGRVPFGGPTRSDVLAAILQGALKPLAVNSDMPDQLTHVISKGLQKEREDRYRTIDEFASALKELRITPPIKPPQTQLKRHAVLLVCGLLVLASLGIGARVWWKSNTPPPITPAPALQRRLSYWLLVQKYRDGKPYEEPFRPLAEINFEPDYRVRLHVKSAHAGHLYILNEHFASTPEAPVYKVLFPSPTANNGYSRVETNEELQIPEQSWFRFDEKRGTEKVWLVWSAQAIPLFEALKSFVNERDSGVVKTPELNAQVKTLLETRRDPPPIAERGEGQKEVVINGSGDILAHLVKLEHH